jgi:SAM-dependent methyltransferase
MTILQRLITTLKRVISVPELLTQDVETLAWMDYGTAPAALEMLGPVKLAEQRILDVGCGLGGKTLYYAEQGARWAIGLDISGERVRVAQMLARQHQAGMAVQFVIGDAARLPFRSDLFDCVISTDTWEHLRAPVLALRECARAVRPGGAVSLSVLPYFSPWGAHAWNWLPLPWIQVLLPWRCLFRLMSWLERRRQINARLPSAVRLDWADPGDPAHARRLTVAALERSLFRSGMTTLRFAVIPVGARYGGIVARLTRSLVRLPLLRELLAGIVIIVQEKNHQDTNPQFGIDRGLGQRAEDRVPHD